MVIADSKETGRGLLACVVLALAVLLATPVDAQVAGATHAGTVSDASGAVIPDAKISIKDKATGLVRDVTTNSAGFYGAANSLPVIRITMGMGGPAYQAATHRSTHATVAVFGAGAAAGCAASLSEQQLCFLLDYSAQQTSGIGAWARDAEHMEKGFLFGGKPASGAFTAAMLIRSGFTDADDMFTGSDSFFEAYAPRENGVIKADPAQLVDKVGERYEITRTNIKKWTFGSPIQAPLDAFAGFFKRRSFTADDAQKVVVRIASDEANTVSDREMPDICMQHMIAITLLDKTLTFASAHDKASMQDPAVLRKRAKVEVVADLRIDARRPRREAIVEMKLADGTQLSESVREVRGTADNPMTRDEVVAKARDLITPVLGAANCATVIEKVLALESVKDVRELRPALQRGSEGRNKVYEFENRRVQDRIY